MSNIVQTRQARPWLQPDLLFRFTHYGAKQRQNLEILHTFTDQVDIRVQLVLTLISIIN